MNRTAFLFDLDGVLVDSVYQHVLAWRQALAAVGIELAVWRIHRRIGMSGGLFINALLRETEEGVSAEQVARIQALHAEAHQAFAPQVRLLFLAAAERLGVPIEAAVVVGDSIWDLLAARRTLGVGLLSGGYGGAELETAGAYRVYDDPADLLHLDEAGDRGAV